MKIKNDKIVYDSYEEFFKSPFITSKPLKRMSPEKKKEQQNRRLEIQKEMKKLGLY